MCGLRAACWQSMYGQLASVITFTALRYLAGSQVLGWVPDGWVNFVPVIGSILAFCTATYLETKWLVKNSFGPGEKPNSEDTWVGRPAIDFDFELKGKEMQLKTLVEENQKPMLMVFYKGYCKECGFTVKEVEELADDKRFKGKVVFMLMNMEDREDAEKFVKEHNIKEHNMLHAVGKPHRHYKVRYVPYMCLLDKSGLFIKSQISLQDVLSEVLEKHLGPSLGLPTRQPISDASETDAANAGSKDAAEDVANNASKDEAADTSSKAKCKPTAAGRKGGTKKKA